MKKTNTFKRFAAITSASILAACMVAPMAMTSNAANTTLTVSDSEATSDSVFSAYKLFDAEIDGGTTTYTVNSKYLTELKEVTGQTTEANVIAYIGGLNADNARAFADSIYAKIKSKDADYTLNKDNEFSDSVAQGYYLVAETTKANADDSYSLTMLGTAGALELTVSPKEAEPELEKKVKDINDCSDTDISDNLWQDSADHDFGDQVPFQLTGTVSAKYANYKEYYYSFHDTLSKGLTLDDSSIKVYIGDEVVTSYFKVINKATDADGNTSFEVMCPDLKKIDGVTADSKIVVEYNATLNDGANIGSLGNPNVAYLEYSTNPYFEGKGTEATEKDENEETGETPEDKVIVFTYQTIINKKDQSGNSLDGAQFALYKATALDGDGKPTAWAATSIELADDSTSNIFKFKGLDDGFYKLVETVTPENYNTIDPIIFEVTATHSETDQNPKLLTFNGTPSSGEVTVDTDNGSLTADVINKYGAELPETGGIGTTLFYLGGGAMVAVAGIYLISKKRMKNAE